MKLQELREAARRREDALKAAMNAKDTETQNRHAKAAAKDSERLFDGILDQLEGREQPAEWDGTFTPEQQEARAAAELEVSRIKTPSSSPRFDSPARRTIEQNVRAGYLPERSAEAAENLILHGDEASKGIAARWAQVTGDPDYGAAFFKMMASERGHILWSPEEQRAYQNVQAFRAQYRAMDTTTGNGGEMLPLYLDPAILLSSDGSNNPLRQIARVVKTTSSTWQGVTSAGVTAEWLGESTEAADASPTLAEAEIPIYRGSAFVPFSYEVGMDALEFSRELARLLIDAADQLQATAASRLCRVINNGGQTSYIPRPGPGGPNASGPAAALSRGIEGCFLPCRHPIPAQLCIPLLELFWGGWCCSSHRGR